MLHYIWLQWLSMRPYESKSSGTVGESLTSSGALVRSVVSTSHVSIFLGPDVEAGQKRELWGPYLH